VGGVRGWGLKSGRGRNRTKNIDCLRVELK